MLDEARIDVGEADEQATEIDLDAPAPEQSTQLRAGGQTPCRHRPQSPPARTGSDRAESPGRRTNTGNTSRRRTTSPESW